MITERDIFDALMSAVAVTIVFLVIECIDAWEAKTARRRRK